MQESNLLSEILKTEILQRPNIYPWMSSAQQDWILLFNKTHISKFISTKSDRAQRALLIQDGADSTHTILSALTNQTRLRFHG